MSHIPTSSPDTRLDNLSKLHRMSRTAGLGSTDYAAINVAAVITAVLGAASLLAMVTPFFLVIPVAGVIVGIIALKQLKASSGTQKGFLIAILGLVACFAFSASTGYKAYAAFQQERTDEATLSALIQSFGNKLAASEYSGAYALLDARFRDRVSLSQFENFFKQMMIPYVGNVKSIESNGHFFIEEAADDASIRRGQGFALVTVEKNPGNQPLRVEVTYRYAADQWKIFNLGEWFPAQAAAAPGAPDQPAMNPAQPQGPGL